jgi:phosphopantetheine adenylyltransferase
MSSAERKIILSGSFNPLHDGHLKLLEVAARYINYILEAVILKCFDSLLNHLIELSSFRNTGLCKKIKRKMKNKDKV